MNVVTVLQKQMRVAVPAARPFPAARVRQPGLTDSTQSFHHIPSRRVSQQIILPLAQDLPCGIPRQLPQPSRKRARFDEYHSVGYTTAWEPVSTPAPSDGGFEEGLYASAET
jgi:hypothetical protein